MKSIATSIAVLLTLGCAANKATPAAPSDTKRYEDRIAQLETRIDKLEKQLEPIDAIDERLSTIEQAISLIISSLEGLEKRLAAPSPDPAPRPGRPDPADVYSIPVNDSPVVGPKHAKVTIVKAYEFACPFCQRAIPTLDQIKKHYGKDVRIVYKSFIVHPQTATRPALAACAANQQGKFKAFYDLAWDKVYATRNFDDANLEKVAKEAGVRNMKRFRKDMDGKCAEEVREEQAMLSSRGVRGTPAFFINGRYISGARPFDHFKPVIDEELEKANKAIKSGMKLRDYYESIVADGKTSI